MTHHPSKDISRAAIMRTVQTVYGYGLAPEAERIATLWNTYEALRETVGKVTCADNDTTSQQTSNTCAECCTCLRSEIDQAHTPAKVSHGR